MKYDDLVILPGALEVYSISSRAERSEDYVSQDLKPWSGLLASGRCLQNRFRQLRRVDNLGSAIIFCQAALDLCPKKHPDRADCLLDLAEASLTRFQHAGDPRIWTGQLKGSRWPHLCIRWGIPIGPSPQPTSLSLSSHALSTSGIARI